MANTFASALVVDIATSEAITVLQNRLAPLRAFASDFSDEMVPVPATGGPLQKIQVPIASSASAVSVNPTSFEAGDVTLTAAEVTPAHYSAGFGLTSAEINQGHRLQRLVRIKLHTLADAIMTAVNTNITTTNFGAAVVTSATNFVSVGMPALWAALQNGTSRALVLDGSLYSQLLPTTKENFALGEQGAYGWDGGIFMNNLMTGGVANLKGFAASTEALAFAGRVPEMDPAVRSLLFEQSLITIPDLGISVQFNLWGSLASRSVRASFDLVFGAQAADKSALKLVTIA
jgi:hypothetical protein